MAYKLLFLLIMLTTNLFGQEIKYNPCSMDIVNRIENVVYVNFKVHSNKLHNREWFSIWFKAIYQDTTIYHYREIMPHTTYSHANGSLVGVSHNVRAKYVFRLQTYLQFTRVGLRAFLLESIESKNMGKLMFNFFVWPEPTWRPRHANIPSNKLKDLDVDGVVGFSDFLIFVQHYGTICDMSTYYHNADFDGNGVVGFSDFLLFSQEFGN